MNCSERVIYSPVEFRISPSSLLLLLLERMLISSGRLSVRGVIPVQDRDTAGRGTAHQAV